MDSEIWLRFFEETGVAFCIGIILGVALFYVLRRVGFVQRIVMPGNDELDESEGVSREWKQQKENPTGYGLVVLGLSVRNAATILAMVYLITEIAKLIAPLV